MINSSNEVTIMVLGFFLSIIITTGLSLQYYKTVKISAFEHGYIEIQNIGTTGYHWNKKEAK